MDANEALLEPVNGGFSGTSDAFQILEGITIKESWCRKQTGGALTVVTRRTSGTHSWIHKTFFEALSISVFSATDPSLPSLLSSSFQE